MSVCTSISRNAAAHPGDPGAVVPSNDDSERSNGGTEEHLDELAGSSVPSFRLRADDDEDDCEAIAADRFFFLDLELVESR